jgi:Family of unknown function (DUF5989)
MNSVGELYAFIVQRKRYWLLPILVPILALHALVTASKTLTRPFQAVGAVSPALLRKLHGSLVVTWTRSHSLHSRHT